MEHNKSSKNITSKILYALLFSLTTLCSFVIFLVLCFIPPFSASRKFPSFQLDGISVIHFPPRRVNNFLRKFCMWSWASSWHCFDLVAALKVAVQQNLHCYFLVSCFCPLDPLWISFTAQTPDIVVPLVEIIGILMLRSSWEIWGVLCWLWRSRWFCGLIELFGPEWKDIPSSCFCQSTRG